MVSGKRHPPQTSKTNPVRCCLDQNGQFLTPHGSRNVEMTHYNVMLQHFGSRYVG